MGFLWSVGRVFRWGNTTIHKIVPLLRVFIEISSWNLLKKSILFRDQKRKIIVLACGVFPKNLLLQILMDILSNTMHYTKPKCEPFCARETFHQKTWSGQRSHTPSDTTGTILVRLPRKPIRPPRRNDSWPAPSMDVPQPKIRVVGNAKFGKLAARAWHKYMLRLQSV